MSDRDRGAISRRDFITRMTVLGSLAAAYPAAALERLRSSAWADDMPWLEEDPWRTIAVVQEHLFPSTQESPGASDFRAIVYLRNTIENPAADGEDKTFIVNGVGWLNELTAERYQRAFSKLDDNERETVLRQIEQSRAGRNWLSLLLSYLLEALLADPVYGGNPGGIGWQWLAHQPGFPRPPADKSWYKLGAPVHYRRKA